MTYVYKEYEVKIKMELTFCGGNKKFIGEVYWGEFFPGGWRMSKLLAGGETHSSSGLEKLSDTKLSDEEWPMSLRGMGLDVTKMSMSTIFSHSSGILCL